MRPKCFGCGLPARNALQRCSALACTVLALLLNGCATHQGAPSISSPTSGASEPQVSRFGKLAFAETSSPASFSFQKAKGKLGTAKEAILDSAELGLSGPGAGVFVAGTVLSELE